MKTQLFKGCFVVLCSVLLLFSCTVFLLQLCVLLYLVISMTYIVWKDKQCIFCSPYIQNILGTSQRTNLSFPVDSPAPSTRQVAEH